MHTPLALELNSVIARYFDNRDVRVSEVCVATAGLLATYLSTIPDHERRKMLVDAVVGCLRQELGESVQGAASCARTRQ
ncbi:MAG: hypothetical protein JWM36_4448 [Hyphomicrobiales bacterium]|jgi:hypothetical protein|nr:hypothetical protein [Hyphomicrobiales bacterium]